MKNSNYKKTDEALTKMKDADKKLCEALTMKGKGERLAKRLQFIAELEG